MKRSVFSAAVVVVVGIALVLPAFAASPSASRSTLSESDEGAVVIVNVKASGSAVYGVTIKDASGSITNVYAPKGWAGVSDGTTVLFRTVDKPIPSGGTLRFRLVTKDGAAGLSVSYRDSETAIGSTSNI